VNPSNAQIPSVTTPDSSKYPTFQTTIPDVGSTSGLIFTSGSLWTHNDSGNPAYLFKIDTNSGNTLQKVFINNYPNNDWEDIDADSNYFYVGDFGNNACYCRTDLRILKVKKSDIPSGLRVQMTAEAINFSYPDQTDFSGGDINHDCEALISVGDSLYIFTKQHGDLHTRLYSLPKTPGTYMAHFIAEFNVQGKITGATINAQQNVILLSGYLSSHSNPFVWELNGFLGNHFFSGTQTLTQLSANYINWQVEGITFTNSLRIWLSNEAISPAGTGIISDSELWKTSLYRLF
jgi:hypothetical protein